MRTFIFAVILMFMVSCSTTKYIEVPTETIKTEYVTNTKIDSVYVRDSIDRFIKGDTLIITKYLTKYKYVNTIDTVIKTDTIPKIVTLDKIEIKEVNKTTLYLDILIWIGFISLVLALLYAIIKVSKLKK